MYRAPRDATSLPVVLAVACGLFALLLPSLLTTAPDAPGVMVLAALTLALALLVRSFAHCAALAANTLATLHPAGDRTRPVLRGRVTDPVHHPLRPRAPGRV